MPCRISISFFYLVYLTQINPPVRQRFPAPFAIILFLYKSPYLFFYYFFQQHKKTVKQHLNRNNCAIFAN